MMKRSRFPSWQEILPVFSLILFIVYSWTIFRIIFQIPSWLMSHTKYGLFNLSVYVFAFALFESLVLMFLVLLLNMVLPKPFFRERFIAQGSLAVIISTIWAIVAQFQRNRLSDSTATEVIAYFMIFTVVLLLAAIAAKFLFDRNKKISDLVASFAERTIVFSWIHIPLGVFSTIVVVFRNLI